MSNGSYKPLKPSKVLERAAERVSPYATPYDDLITREARRRGIDPELARAVAYWESKGNPEARGAAGEVGLFQVIPSDVADRFPWARTRPSVAELQTPEAQVAAGLDILKSALESAGGDIRDALAIYNSGRPTARAPAITTEKYIPSVLSIYENLRGIGTPSPTAVRREVSRRTTVAKPEQKPPVTPSLPTGLGTHQLPSPSGFVPLTYVPPTVHGYTPLTINPLTGQPLWPEPLVQPPQPTTLAPPTAPTVSCPTRGKASHGR